MFLPDRLVFGGKDIPVSKEPAVLEQFFQCQCKPVADAAIDHEINVVFKNAGHFDVQDVLILAGFRQGVPEAAADFTGHDGDPALQGYLFFTARSACRSPALPETGSRKLPV